MIESMTGYGGAEGEFGGDVYAVEIKTVNNRYFKSRIKLPDVAAFLEEDIEKMLQKELSRGMVNYTLQLKNVAASELFNIDETAFCEYAKKLKNLCSLAEIGHTITAGDILVLPGIILPARQDDEQIEQIRKAVLQVSQEAINKLKEMRAVEGKALAVDMKKHCSAITENLGRIKISAADGPDKYSKKLEKKLNDLLSNEKFNFDEVTLAREVAIFAEKSDISEEIARLDSHINQFEKTCESNGQAGRKLDFISQEMLREANTIASKSINTEIIHWVVDIKCLIDRIKEQVQNVE